MLTNNFYIALKSLLIGGGSTTDKILVKNTNGTSYSYNPGFHLGTSWEYYYKFYRSDMPILSQNSNITQYDSYGIVLGSDNTPPTPEDYKLKSYISNGLAITRVLKSAKEYSEVLDEEFFGATQSLSISCTASAGRTIGEIGWVTNMGFSGSFLIDRTVFETPIVLEYQNTCVIDYTIMNRISLAKLGQ